MLKNRRNFLRAGVAIVTLGLALSSILMLHLHPLLSSKWKFSRSFYYSGSTSYGQVYVHKRTGMQFVLISEALADEAGLEWPEGTAMRRFLISRTEVPQAVWQRVMGYNPSTWNRADNPVETVSRPEAESFATKVGAALPTLEQWELICSGSLDGTEDGHCRAYIGGSTRSVTGGRPNRLGLFEVSGNVSEWIRGSHDGGSLAVGGSWVDDSWNCRCEKRDRYEDSDVRAHVGLRLVFELEN